MKFLKKNPKSQKLIVAMVLIFSLSAIAPQAQAGIFRDAAKAIVNAVKGLGEAVIGIFVDTEAQVKTSPTRIKASMAEVILINDRRADGQVSSEAASEYLTLGIKD